MAGSFPLGCSNFSGIAAKFLPHECLILGLKPGFRRRGIDAMLYLRLWQEAHKERLSGCRVFVDSGGQLGHAPGIGTDGRATVQDLSGV